jgi:hypothetical protein
VLMILAQKSVSRVWVEMQIGVGIHQHLPQQTAILMRNERVIPTLKAASAFRQSSPELTETPTCRPPEHRTPDLAQAII